ncbi:MFS general substrate transporter [Lentithecium fluviatile CBS 122367]|uniref:MFS general substrate transporter n=1 Tax=Lentithecium fluviatile CBS 122367 TaxID=1168545 RepID=A0A6G1JJ37_9PLEO|nr:MFS general substrate transporter [Lentithecium fluviatile CBS 122367]
MTSDLEALEPSNTGEKITMTISETPPTASSILILTQWLQILSTFIIFFNTRGLLLTFGVFQTHYEQVLLRKGSSSDILWISTTGVFIVLPAGSLASIRDVHVGLGAGIAFTPSVAAAVATLTDPATRAKAMGLIACGSSIGGIIYPLMFRSIIPSTGFPWAVRSIAFVILRLYLVSYLALLYHPKTPPITRPFFDVSALKDAPFMTLSVASLFSATAFYIPLLHMPLLAKIRDSSTNPDLLFDLLAILNGALVPGRLLSGIVAARFGPTETVLLSLLCGTVLVFFWIVVDSVAGIIVWAVSWGMVSGVLVTKPGAFIPLFCLSLAVIGTRSGMYWVCVRSGILIGSLIGGAIYDFEAADEE